MSCRYFIQPLLFSALTAVILGCGSSMDKRTSNMGPTPSMSPMPGAPASPTPSPTPTPMPGVPTPTPMSAEVQLSARGEMVISGVQAELRGQFERRPDRTRLDGQLEDINLPVGSAISFCLMQGGQTIPLAVGIIQLQDQRREAEFHIRTDQGQNPPNVQAGDVLQARDGANVTMADCSRPLLVAGTFVPDNNSGMSGS